MITHNMITHNMITQNMITQHDNKHKQSQIINTA